MFNRTCRGSTGMQAIVVGTDGTPEAHAAVLEAGALARESGATLHLVAAYRRVATTRRDRAAAPRDVMHCLGPRGELDELLAEAEADLRARCVEVKTWWSTDSVSRLMRRVARTVGAELVVCGPELSLINDRPRRRWLGRRHPIAARVARHATWRVMDLGLAPVALPVVAEPEQAAPVALAANQG